jgi:hypothetical protein
LGTTTQRPLAVDGVATALCRFASQAAISFLSISGFQEDLTGSVDVACTRPQRQGFASGPRRAKSGRFDASSPAGVPGERLVRIESGLHRIRCADRTGAFSPELFHDDSEPNQ